MSLNCNCPECQSKGVSGLNCGGNYPPTDGTGVSGLADGGLNVNLMGTVTGGAIGLGLGYIFGWDMKLSTAVGAITGGFVLPSMYS